MYLLRLIVFLWRRISTSKLALVDAVDCVAKKVAIRAIVTDVC